MDISRCKRVATQRILRSTRTRANLLITNEIIIRPETERLSDDSTPQAVARGVNKVYKYIFVSVIFFRIVAHSSLRCFGLQLVYETMVTLISIYKF